MSDKVRELVEKWRTNYPLAEDMDYSYRIDAEAHNSCASELEAALAAPEPASVPARKFPFGQHLDLVNPPHDEGIQVDVSEPEPAPADEAELRERLATWLDEINHGSTEPRCTSCEIEAKELAPRIRSYVSAQASAAVAAAIEQAIMYANSHWNGQIPAVRCDSSASVSPCPIPDDNGVSQAALQRLRDEATVKVFVELRKRATMKQKLAAENWMEDNGNRLSPESAVYAAVIEMQEEQAALARLGQKEG